VGGDTYRSSSRPAPPSINRPVPPSVDRPVPPPVDGGIDRPVPPPVHVPRYFWSPSFPVFVPSNPQQVPQIPLPPAPQGPRQVGMNEVSNDPVQLLAEHERLRSKSKTLFITTHPKLSAEQAHAALNSRQTIYLAPDGGMHTEKNYQPITSQDQLNPMLPDLKNQKLGELQSGENAAAQQRANAWVESDVENRMNRLPSFNSVYDTNRMSLENYMVSVDGRSFNRNMITAMNIYNQEGTRRDIATQWHNNPNMSTPEFNAMANNVVREKVANLFWNADYQGDWGTYMGSNPVPGLRYPDTQEDADYNAAVIRNVASQLPLLLDSTVNR
jgi:hypothetical protein